MSIILFKSRTFLVTYTDLYNVNNFCIFNGSKLLFALYIISAVHISTITGTFRIHNSENRQEVWSNLLTLQIKCIIIFFVTILNNLD